MNTSRNWIRIDKITGERSEVPLVLVLKVAVHHDINFIEGIFETEFAMYKLKRECELGEIGRAHV